jgi:hypothetical protein
LDLIIKFWSKFCDRAADWQLIGQLTDKRFWCNTSVISTWYSKRDPWRWPHVWRISKFCAHQNWKVLCWLVIMSVLEYVTHRNNNHNYFGLSFHCVC